MNVLVPDIEPAIEADPDTAEAIRVLHYLFFPGGGIGRYAHELVGLMNRVDGLEIELACPTNYEWLDGADYSTWPGLLPVGSGNRLTRRLGFLRAQFANPSRAMRRARETGCQIVHLSNINHLTFPFWSRTARRAGLKIVATAHDVRRAKAMIHRGYENRQLASFYASADALFVHSAHQRDDLLEFSECDPERVHIVPHGPYSYGAASGSREELRDRLGLPRVRSVAIFFGQIRDEKNLDILIRALGRCPDRPHLVVAGHSAGGAHRGLSGYRELADECSISDDITFVEGYLPDELVADYFTAADFVALPYRRSFTSQSGVLNVAAHYRRPVLATDTVTFRETIETCRIGRLVEGEDVETLTEGLEWMTRHARSPEQPWEFDDYETRFGWDANVRTTVEVYRSLVAEGAR